MTTKVGEFTLPPDVVEVRVLPPLRVAATRLNVAERAELAAKPSPVTVTVAPAGPLVGLRKISAFTVKVWVLLLPATSATFTFCEPTRPAEVPASAAGEKDNRTMVPDGVALAPPEKLACPCVATTADPPKVNVSGKVTPAGVVALGCCSW